MLTFCVCCLSRSCLGCIAYDDEFAQRYKLWYCPFATVEVFDLLGNIKFILFNQSWRQSNYSQILGFPVHKESIWPSMNWALLSIFGNLPSRTGSIKLVTTENSCFALSNVSRLLNSSKWTPLGHCHAWRTLPLTHLLCYTNPGPLSGIFHCNMGKVVWCQIHPIYGLQHFSSKQRASN